MTFYLKEEFLSFDHFDIWDEQDQLVYSAKTVNLKKSIISAKSSMSKTPPGGRLPRSSTCRFPSHASTY